MGNEPTNNVFIRMTKADVNRLDVLCSIHGMTRPHLISQLLDRAWESVTRTGKLEEWLASLAGAKEEH